MATSKDSLNADINHITEDDVKLIVSRYSCADDDNIVANYSVHIASDKMLGFLAEYLKLIVHLTNRNVIYFFIKSISRTNIAKAKMVKEMKLFENEIRFYSNIKKLFDVPDIEPWAPRLITLLNDAMVFEDLNGLHYKLRNKFDRFDMAHTLQALKTLARFHASSIIFEDKKTKETQQVYKICYDFEQVLDNGGYHISSDWFVQCMRGAFEAMQTFSKYNKTEMNIIDCHWHDIWSEALDLNEFSPRQKNVICHRDLWNNNIMFHYKNGKDNELVPDNCLLVDFQTVRYQAPASDVMILLCCNLDPKFREENIEIFLNFYYKEIQTILSNHKIEIDNIMTKKQFIASAEKQTKWGLIVCACLMPQFWIDDDLTTNIFTDSAKFNEILCTNKGMFIKNMMESNLDYKEKVMEIFEEIADRYCFNSNKM